MRLWKQQNAKINKNVKYVGTPLLLSNTQSAENEKMTNVEGIFHAKDITKEEYFQKIKQRNDYLTDDDIYQIYRYNIKNCNVV